MTISSLSACAQNAVAPRRAIRKAGFFALLAILLTLRAPDSSAATAWCYQEELGTVQQTLTHSCKGRIVSTEEAQAIQAKRDAYIRRAMQDKDWLTRNGLKLGGVGSGFAVSAAGHIVTNHHVIDECRSISVMTPAGQEFDVTLLTNEPSRDLALLKMAGDVASPALFAQPQSRLSGANWMGRTVRFLGYPNQGRPPLRPFDRTGQFLQLSAGPEGIPVIVFNGEIRPGNSGGPLLTPDGKVIGLVFAKANLPEIYKRAGDAGVRKMKDVAFALPFWEVLLFLEQTIVPYQIATGTETAPEPDSFMVRVNCWK